MYYVYILKSRKDNKLYTGCTNNLKQRLYLHNNGLIESTKNRKPLTLIYFEALLNKKDAFRREQWLKTGWGRNHLKKLLKNYFENLGR